jgi:UDP-glucose 4-epimerase
VAIFGTDYPTADGTAVRDYVHVEDLAAAHLLALDKAVPGRHDIFTLGSESGNSVREVIEAARRVTGREIVAVEEPRRPGDPPRLVASNARARAELGWAPERSLDDMVRDAWTWHQAHPDGY